MKSVPSFQNKYRNAANYLSLAHRFSIEYFDELCDLRKENTDTEIQLSPKLNTIHRALWTSLIVEVRKLFGSSFGVYENYSLKEIPFFQSEPYKETIDKAYGNHLIKDILTTSNTFTVHLSAGEIKILATNKICESNLKKVLEILRKPLEDFEEYARKADSNTD